MVAPLLILTGVWFWKQQAWGHTLAGIVLIKAATLETAVLSMVDFIYLESVPVVWAQSVLYRHYGSSSGSFVCVPEGSGRRC